MYLPIETVCYSVGYLKSYQQSGNFSGYCRDYRVFRADPRGGLTRLVTGKATTAQIVCPRSHDASFFLLVAILLKGNKVFSLCQHISTYNCVTTLNFMYFILTSV